MKNRLIKLLSFILAVVCIPVNYIHAEENIIQYEMNEKN